MATGQLFDTVEKLQSCPVLKRKEYLRKIRDWLETDSNHISLDEKSIQTGSSVTWQNLFQECHNVYQEALNDVGCKESSIKAALREEARKLVSLVGACANRDKDLPYLDFEKACQMCMGAASKETTKECREMYVKLLHNKLVALNGYRVKFTTEICIKIVDFCVDLFPSAVAILKCELLHILEICIILGSKQTLVAVHLKNKLQFFENILEYSDEFPSKQHFAELALRTNLALASELALEYRFALCKIGETILPTGLNLIKNDMTVFIKYCLLQMALHHPGGAEKDSSNFFASDLEIWNDILVSIFHMVQTELRNLFKTVVRGRNSRNQEVEVGNDLLNLAVEVYKQIFSLDDQDTNLQMNVTMSASASAGPSAKRTKIEVGIPMLIDQLKSAKRSEEISVRLNVISFYLKKYGSTLSQGDYFSLLQFLSETQALGRTNAVLRQLCNCCRSLLQGYPLQKLDATEAEAVKSLWLKVWDMAIRSAGLNQCIEGSNDLLQALLRSNFASELNTSSLLGLYTRNTIHLNCHSLRTLVTLTTNCFVPDLLKSINEVANCSSQNLGGESQNWKLVLAWLLPSKEDEDERSMRAYTKLPPQLLAEALIRCMCKNRITLKTSSQLDISDVNASSFQNIHNTYNPSSGVKMEMPEKETSFVPRPQFFESGPAIVTTMLSKRFKEVSSEMKRDETTQLTMDPSQEQFVQSVHQAMISAAVLTHLLNADLLDVEEFPEFPTVHEMKRLLNYNIPSSFERLMEVKKNEPPLEQIVVLEKLYSEDNHKLVANLIRESTPDYFLQKLFSQCNFKVTKRIAVEHFSEIHSHVESTTNYCPYPITGTLTRPEETMVVFTKVFASFCFHSKIDYTNRIEGFSLNILNMCYELKQNSRSLANMQRILLTLKIASQVASNLNEEHANYIMECLRELTILHRNYADIVIPILDILQDMLEYLNRKNGKTHRSFAQSIVKGFKVLVEKKKTFGRLVRMKLIQCMKKWISLDPTQTWAMLKDEPVALAMLDFVKDELHEVRMSTISHLQEIFRPDAPDWSAHQVLEWRATVFSKLSTLINELFNALDSNSVEKDELRNLGISGLSCLGVAVAHCPEQRNAAIYSLFELIKLQHINPDLVQKTVNTLNDSLSISEGGNVLEPCLASILLKWSSNYDVLDFPSFLFGFSSIGEFAESHQERIVTTLVVLKDKKNLKALARLLSKPEKDIVKESKVLLLFTCLPYMALKDNLSQDVLIKLENCFTVLRECFNEEEIDTILDTRYWERQLGVSFVDLPSTDELSLDHNTFKEIMHWIQQKLPDSSIPVMAFVARSHPSHCQSIMQGLARRVFKAPTKEDRLLRFLQYSSLVLEMCSFVSSGLLGKTSAFFVRDVVHVLLNVIDESTNAKHVSLSAAACHCLRALCVECCTSHSDLLKCQLPTIINALVKVVKKTQKRPVAAKALEIMEYLVIEQGSLLKEAIWRLEQFPQLPEFYKIQAAYEQILTLYVDDHLESAIKSFLAAREAANESRVEGLQLLCTKLSTEKTQLQILYDELKVTSNASNSTLFVLVRSLVKLISNHDKEIALYAAACLGELGPGQLMSIVLADQNRCKHSQKPLILLYQRKLELLLKYIVDPDIDVCCHASELLHLVLQSPTGKSALELLSQPDYLFPFQSDSQEDKTPLQINDVKFLSTLDDVEIWCPSAPCSHSQWIVNLTSSILLSFSFSRKYTRLLQQLCEAKEQFADALLPPLLLLVLVNDKECGDLVVVQMNEFFARHFMNRDMNPKNFARQIMGNKSSIKCMLNVVQFLRENSVAGKLSELNYLHVSQAANYCSAFFSCIYYGELWGLEKKIARNGKLRSIEEVCDSSPDGKALHANLVQTYTSIADPDAIYGCGMSRLLDRDSQIHYYEHCKRWDKVLLLNDLSSTNSNAAGMLQGMMPALHHLGLQNLLKTNLDLQDRPKMRAAQLECCWRLGNWEQPTPMDLGQLEDVPFEIAQYSALKSLVICDFDGVKESISLGKGAVIRKLQQSNLESTQNIYGAMSQLQMLQEIEDALDSRLAVKTMDGVLLKWEMQDKKSTYRFEHYEPVLSQRLCLMKTLLQLDFNAGHSSMDENSISRATAELLLKLSATARAEKCFHVSERALLEMSEMKSICEALRCRHLLEKANNFWDQGDAIFAKQILIQLIRKLKTLSKEKNQFDLSALKTTYALALKTFGNWLVETGSENPRVIIDEYLSAAVKIFEEDGGQQLMPVSEKVSAFRTLANFADIEYQRVVKYMNSPHFKSKVEHMNKSAMSVAALGNAKNTGDKDFKIAVKVNEVQSNNDKNEIDATDAERKEFLKLAMDYYIKCLALSDERISTVFRVINLWLENKDEVSEKLDFSKVPSYKFIPLVPQLTPHLKPSSDHFQRKIGALIMRLAEEHAHHTLPNILALKFASLDHQFDDSVKQSPNESRSVEAENLIKKLKTKPKLQQIIKQLEAVTNAVVELAYFSKEEWRQMTANKIPKELKITKIQTFDKIQVATCSLPVQKSGNYRPCGILRYETQFQLVGGIHAPKKIMCLSMDGSKHVQLCKGLDDLHLDAVMQQVFTIMNDMFLRNPNTSNRKLSVRTYNVCPLSQRSGLIEWCKNTIPIGSYLTEAHPRYNKDDAPPIECRKNMSQCEGNLQNRARRLRVYEEICSKIRPVFFNFFLERFLLPAVWFEKRLAYTRSVATSSMIGYILGLGDRHVQNILVDTTTAEVIHIDFGIAFEQALVLRIPELVPFRLSRDIESGFGISGTAGVFQKSCEAAMQVLRDNQKTILTILQVLLYNPMYVWTISLSQNQNDRSGMKGERMDRSADKANQLAERALLRLQQKLMGTEEGMANSVEGQVSRLIQTARDPQNLGLMFCGWQPYL
ncbi:Hypothetical predicted protein [Cloeon dipterum]|uniref:non-specific serine/threonine protein kinase n=1 Tax=Cloeon dipterum TaxID=197152 RepID=A0A8S1CAC0_9INSE|nr:Hypothetical predicted protein [Cloeon dipterum]